MTWTEYTRARLWEPFERGGYETSQMDDDIRAALAEIERLQEEVERLQQVESLAGRLQREVERLRAEKPCQMCQNKILELGNRVRTLEEALRGFAEGDCEYGDGCPTFGTNHGRCVPCKARAALREEGR
jgi:predicted RNase H-like nuclease (RuvC/YqgF family)